MKQANFSHYNKLRGTINKWRLITRAKLPKKLQDIDFELDQFKPYTLTNEKKLFLQYDNRNPDPKKRIEYDVISSDD